MESHYIHWEFFKAIEEDFKKCSRYIAFDERNLQTYSIELSRLIIDCGSYIDTLMKDLCCCLEPQVERKDYDNIKTWHAPIKGHLSHFFDLEIHMPSNGMVFTPWKEWKQVEDKIQSPFWWKYGYNQIKHHRSNNFEAACLKNALECAAGLLVLIMCYSVHVSNPKPCFDVSQHKVFIPKNLVPTFFAPVTLFCEYETIEEFYIF
ncbi:hypothetical protein [Desulfocurvibacter africanus]|uniref:hypothetical protein n=1 Tax=Desulfocurvibacter africanus TaxID=873 RepID=UPI0004867811|nr:hypothetical protein [Desulfocurvibacter africanus]